MGSCYFCVACARHEAENKNHILLVIRQLGNLSIISYMQESTLYTFFLYMCTIYYMRMAVYIYVYMRWECTLAGLP
jgi:hypothetical protein